MNVDAVINLGRLSLKTYAADFPTILDLHKHLVERAIAAYESATCSATTATMPESGSSSSSTGPRAGAT